MTEIKINLSFDQIESATHVALKNFRTNVDQALGARGAGIAYIAGVLNNLFFYGAEKMAQPDFAGFLCLLGGSVAAGVEAGGLYDYASDETVNQKEASKYIANTILNLGLNVGATAIGLPALKLLAIVPLFLPLEQAAPQTTLKHK